MSKPVKSQMCITKVFSSSDLFNTFG